MKLDINEKVFLDKIVSICASDKKSVRDLFKSILASFTLSVLSGDNEVIIPYLCKLKLSYDQIETPEGIKLEVKLDAEPSNELVEEIRCILVKKDPPTKKFFMKEIHDIIKNNYLEIEDVGE